MEKTARSRIPRTNYEEPNPSITREAVGNLARGLINLIINSPPVKKITAFTKQLDLEAKEINAITTLKDMESAGLISPKASKKRLKRWREKNSLSK